MVLHYYSIYSIHRYMVLYLVITRDIFYICIHSHTYVSGIQDIPIYMYRYVCPEYDTESYICAVNI